MNRYQMKTNTIPFYVKQEQSPLNSEINGGIDIKAISLDHGVYNDVKIEGNNISVVVLLRYQNVLFVCPGDIEPAGWNILWATHGIGLSTMIQEVDIRVLVAPHHGRKSGYSDAMMQAISPHLVIVSDVYGESETHPNYHSKPLGINFSDGDIVKYYSTKSGGRVQITISETERIFGQYDR
jgi:beta-lactamase superfamily II metal-dependent hydrolase